MIKSGYAMLLAPRTPNHVACKEANLAKSIMRPCQFCGKEFARSRPDANRQNHCSIACRVLGKLSPPTERGCWEYRGARHRFGYGMVRDGPRSITVHRFMWELCNGPAPDGMHVCHSCDNPGCGNPAHLFLGTHLDNMRDMSAKGRHGMLGAQHSPETRAKIAANRGVVIMSPEGRARVAEATRRRWQRQREGR